VDVTIESRHGRAHPGITVHRVRRLHPDDVIDDDGIRRTNWARTLLDLAGVLRDDALRKPIHRLEALRLLDLHEVDACLARNPGRREAPVLLAALARYRPHDHSEHERLLYELCLEAGFDEPERNRATDGFERSMEIDLRWPERRLCIEADGREFHDSTDSFHEDRRKDRALRIGGWLVFRFTWEDVTTRREQTLRELREIERMTHPAGGGSKSFRQPERSRPTR
jgi:very-short-patch-repair endonuclease